MLKIRWDALNGISLPEGTVERWARLAVEDFLKNGDMEISVGSTVLINAFRILIKKGQLRPDQVQFIVEDEVLPVDENGRFHRWPMGFADIINRQLLELL